MEKIRVTKKLESTKEHHQTVKQQYESKIAQLQNDEVQAQQQKQRKRKKRSKQAATNCNLDKNKPVSENGARPNNKEPIEQPEALTNYQHSPNPISKKDGNTVKESDVGIGKNQEVTVQKR